MRRRLGLCAAAGLMTAFAPAEFGRAVLGGGEALAIERREPAAGPKKARAAKSSVPRREQPQDGRPRFGKPSSYVASFAPALYGRPYASGPFVPNPLVSSEHRATPEYDYLYTAALTSASPPSPSSYRYAADSSYLLRPTFGRSGIALAYRWRHCMNAGVGPAPRGLAVQLGAPDAPVVSRDRGQKIDNALNPSILAGHPSARGSAGGPNLQLAEAFRPSGWGSAETHRPCVTVR
jgi:hypothetical protein